MWLNGKWVEVFDMNRALYAEGSGEEGAGDDGNADKTEDKPDVSKQIADLSTALGKVTAELMSLKKGGSTKGLEAKIAALEAKLTEKTEASSEESEHAEEEEAEAKQGKKEVDPVMAEMKKELKRLQTESKKHNELLTAEQQRREASEQRLRNSELDRQLSEALAEVKAVNVKDAIKFLRSDAEWSEENGEWVFPDGEEKLSVAVAVEKMLPKYMRQPANKGGGSGGRSSGMEDTSSKAQLQEIAIQTGILAKKMRGADEYVTRATEAKRAAVAAGVDAQVIVKAIMAAPAA